MPKDKEARTSRVPEEVEAFFEQISKAHGTFYMKDIRYLVNIMLDFSESLYIKAMKHGAKHGYERAMEDLAVGIKEQMEKRR